MSLVIPARRRLLIAAVAGVVLVGSGSPPALARGLRAPYPPIPLACPEDDQGGGERSAQPAEVAIAPICAGDRRALCRLALRAPLLRLFEMSPAQFEQAREDGLRVGEIAEDLRIAPERVRDALTRGQRRAERLREQLGDR